MNEGGPTGYKAASPHPHLENHPMSKRSILALATLTLAGCPKEAPMADAASAAPAAGALDEARSFAQACPAPVVWTTSHVSP